MATSVEPKPTLRETYLHKSVLQGRSYGILEPMTSTDPLEFPDAPRLELERLLEQVVDHAGQVMSTQARLRALIRASGLIAGARPQIKIILRHVAWEAAQLAHADQAAIGLFDDHGYFERTVHVHTGKDEGPSHLGRTGELLSQILQDSSPVRITTSTADPTDVGMAPGEYPAGVFLAIPVGMGDQVYAGLYLAKDTGAFTRDDEQLLSSLAATAGIAINHARLLEESRRREQSWVAAAEVTQQVLSDEIDADPLQLLAERISQLVDADIVAVILPADHGGAGLSIHCAAGAGADRLVGQVVPHHGTVAADVIASGEPRLVTEPEPGSVLALDRGKRAFGPAMVVPLMAGETTLGVLTMARRKGSRPFGGSDLELIESFAGQAAIALERAQLRSDREQLLVLQDRDRIARDLHDHVIQRLFAAGLSIQSIASGLEAEPAVRLNEQVEQLNATIQQIRHSISNLRASPTSQAGLRAQVLEIAREMTPLLAQAPAVVFDGPVETMTDAPLAHDVAAVVREGLSNAGRHAAATQVSVKVAVEHGWLELTITDDGKGPAPQPVYGGLANLSRRAATRGGTLSLEPAIPSGSRLSWRVPISGNSTGGETS